MRITPKNLVEIGFVEKEDLNFGGSVKTGEFVFSQRSTDDPKTFVNFTVFRLTEKDVWAFDDLSCGGGSARIKVTTIPQIIKLICQESIAAGWRAKRKQLEDALRF